MSEVNFRYGEMRKFADDVEETRTIEFVISTDSKDRHGTVLNQKKWNLKNFNRNGIVGYQHNVHGGDMCSGPNPDDVIGIGKAWVEDGQLIGSVKFEPADINPLAEKIFRKVLHGTLKATSVGFLPIGEGRWGEGDESREGPNPTYYFAGQELLEFSIVNIPSNPDAVARSIRDQTHNALMFVKKALGDDYSFGDIEKMTVGEVLKSLPSNSRNNIHSESQKPEPIDAPVAEEVENKTIEKPEEVAETKEDNKPEERTSEQDEDNSWKAEAEARVRKIKLNKFILS